VTIGRGRPLFPVAASFLMPLRLERAPESRWVQDHRHFEASSPSRSQWALTRIDNQDRLSGSENKSNDAGARFSWWLGRRRLESLRPLMAAADANVQGLSRAARRARSPPCIHPLSDAVDFHRYREAAVPTWHSRVHEPAPDARIRPIHEPLAKMQGAVEHSRPKRSAQCRNRLVAQSPAEADPWFDGVDLYHRAAGPFDQGWPDAAEIRYIRRSWRNAGRTAHASRPIVPAMESRLFPLASEIDQERRQAPGAVLPDPGECISIQSAAAWLLAPGVGFCAVTSKRWTLLHGS